MGWRAFTIGGVPGGGSSVQTGANVKNVNCGCFGSLSELQMSLGLPVNCRCLWVFQ